jgi:hypothetical protein
MKKAINNSTRLGNCDICAEQKILFINGVKWYEVWSIPKGIVQKIFHNLLWNFNKGLSKKVGLNFVHLALTKVNQCSKRHFFPRIEI